MGPYPDGVNVLTGRWTLLGSLAGAAAAGTAVHFAFPGYSWWPLAILGVTLFALSVRGAGRVPGTGGVPGTGHSVRAAAGIGFVFGLALLLPLLRWTGLQVGWFPWIALCLFQALFYAAAGVSLTLTGRLPRAWQRVLFGTCAWLAVEAVQGRYPWGGFGWSRLGFSQSTSPLLGLAALAGVPLLSAAVVAAGLLLAELPRPARARPGRGRPGILRAGILRAGILRVGTVTAAALAVVLAGLLVPTPVRAEEGELQVAGIQGNVPRLGMEFNAQRRAVLDNHARGTHQLAHEVAADSTPQPDLVVWPENASDIDPLTNRDATEVIDEAVDAIGVTTLLGGITVRDGEVFNTVLQWEPGDGPSALYDKRAPVPFAEYVPHRAFFRAITPLVDQAGRFSAGDEVGLMQVRARDGRQVPVGVLICFEVVQDPLVADVAGSAQLLVVPTNNATFELSDESRQQLGISRIRAVQTGRAIAHVSTVGVSALVAPDGTIVDGSELFTPDILSAALPLRSTPTTATRVGAVPELVLAALGVLGLLAGVRRPQPPVPSDPAPHPAQRRTRVPTRIPTRRSFR